MEKNYKNKIFILGGLCLVFLALILLLVGVQKRQITRQKATGGGGPVNLSLSPNSGNINQTGTTISVAMTNTASVNKRVRGAEVTLELDANAASRFEVSAAACSSFFPNVAGGMTASGNRVVLSCSQSGGGNAFSIASGTHVDIGTFVLKAKSGATAGTGNISFASANIPESLVYTNLYGSGITGTFTVSGGSSTTAPTATLTPMATPTRILGCGLGCNGRAAEDSCGNYPNLFCKVTNTRTGYGVCRNIRCPDATGCNCASLSPTPTANANPVCNPGEWSVTGCKRCLSNSTWSPACSDFGRWDSPTITQNDPDASFPAYCACARQCNLTGTPIPTACPLAPTATPRPGTCITCPAGRPAHNLGNANCDYVIDRTDLNFWINRNLNADFNCNGQVDRDDLSKWIANFGARMPTPTPR